MTCKDCIHYEACGVYVNADRFKDVEKYCKEFEDKILYIKLPCKVGDELWITENPYTFLPLKKPVNGEVVSLWYNERGTYIRVLFDTKKINGCRDYFVDKLGKQLHLTREEAEAALKEREK